jgi:hypothetical protein
MRLVTANKATLLENKVYGARKRKRKAKGENPVRRDASGVAPGESLVGSYPGGVELHAAQTYSMPYDPGVDRVRVLHTEYSARRLGLKQGACSP